MSIYYKSDDNPIFKVFEHLAHLAFNCNWDGENIIGRGPEPIRQDRLSLLLAWPAILMMRLVQITGDKFYDKALKDLTTILDNGADYNQIKEFLDKIVGPKTIPNRIAKEAHEAVENNDKEKISKIKRELYNYVPDLYTKTILLLHPRNLSLVTNRELFTLIYSLTDFFVLWCMIVRCFVRNDGDTYITKKDMYVHYSKCANTNHLDIYSLSLIFPTMLDSFVNDEIDKYFNLKENYSDPEILLVSNINTPTISFILNRIVPENYISYIKKYNSNNTDFGLTTEILGIGYNIRKILGYPNELWRTISLNNPKSSGYLLFNKEKIQKDFVSTLIEELFRSAMKGTMAVELVKTSWKTFLEKPNKKVGNNLEKYYDWVSSILFHNYLIREEFFNFKSFSRIIGNIDTDLDYLDVNDARNLYKKGKKYHIPFDHKNKLYEANIELQNFINTVVKMTMDQDDTIAFFHKTKSDYKYISLLEEDDIKKIVFSTGGNALRDSRRLILSTINEKLGGKEYGDSTLTKLLGLEKGSQDYLKFAE